MQPNPYQRILQKTFDGRIPLTAHWELTYRCNLSCVHCYATDKTGRDELSAHEIRHGLDQLAEAGCLFLAFTGGEIFCREDLFEILEAARRNDFAMRLLTNGTLITPAAADRVAALNPLGVDISLYAMTPGVHDRITGTNGSHRRTAAAIRLLRDRGVRVTINVVLLKCNVAEFAALTDFAGSVGAELKFDYLLTPTDDGARPMTAHGLSEDEITEFVRAHITVPESAPTAPDGDEPLCGAGSNALCITPRGDVLPCLAVRESVGNLKRQSLKRIWESPRLAELRDARYCNLRECRRCELAAYCARCPGVALAECGSVLARSDSACLAARATKRALDALTGEAT